MANWPKWIVASDGGRRIFGAAITFTILAVVVYVCFLLYAGWGQWALLPAAPFGVAALAAAEVRQFADSEYDAWVVSVSFFFIIALIVAVVMTWSLIWSLLFRVT